MDNRGSESLSDFGFERKGTGSEPSSLSGQSSGDTRNRDEIVDDPEFPDGWTCKWCDEDNPQVNEECWSCGNKRPRKDEKISEDEEEDEKDSVIMEEDSSDVEGDLFL